VPWSTIGLVGSAVTLAAFLAALGAWSYRRRLEQIENILKSAPAADRVRALESVIATVRVNTSSLTREQQYDLALKLLAERSASTRTAATAVVSIAVLAAVVALVALTQGAGGTSTTPSQKVTAIAASPNATLTSSGSTIKDDLITVRKTAPAQFSRAAPDSGFTIEVVYFYQITNANPQSAACRVEFTCIKQEINSSNVLERYQSRTHSIFLKAGATEDITGILRCNGYTDHRGQIALHSETIGCSGF